jgi:hypothetical protein
MQWKRIAATVALLWISAWLFLGSASLFNLATQVTGILPCADMPALTGPITTTAGACATSQADLTGALSSAVTMTTAGTFYAGPTVSLTAGTWHLTGSVSLQTTSTASAVEFTCKLWDGTTTAGAGYAAIGAVGTAAVRNEQMALTGVLAETGSVTGEISCTSNTASQLIEAATGYTSPGNYASTLVAIRIK